MAKASRQLQNLRRMWNWCLAIGFANVLFKGGVPAFSDGGITPLGFLPASTDPVLKIGANAWKM